MESRVHDSVKRILEVNEQARSNINELIALTYFRLGYPTDLFELSKRKDAPKIESIERARREIVKENPELKGTKEVEEQRIENTKKYIDYDLWGIME